MMQAADSLVGEDITGGYGTQPVVRCSLPKSKMRAILVVVADVFREQPFQMAFVNCDDVIQQISSATLDPTLRHAVLPGTLAGGADRVYLQGSNGCRDFQPILPIPVEDQKPGRRLEWK